MARLMSGRTRFAPRALALAALFLGPVAASGAWAAAEEPESPRVAVSIGPVGIVLIAANKQLYAFLDQLSDNAPVAGGQVTVKGPKIQLTLTETAPGLYRAGPFVPAVGHTPLTVSVESALGAGQTAAELVVAPPSLAPTAESRLRPAWYTLGIAAMAGLGWLAWRGRRRTVPPLAGAGTV